MDRRIEKTRSAIQAAYFRMIREKAGERITISEIAREANIDRKTFYLHYECVEDILKDFFTDRIRELMGSLQSREIFRSSAHIDLFFDELNALIMRDRTLYTDLLRSRSFGFFWEQIQQILEQMLIADYASRVSIPDNELRIYCRFFVSGIISVYHSYLMDPEAMDSHRLAEIITDIYANGGQAVVLR